MNLRGLVFVAALLVVVAVTGWWWSGRESEAPPAVPTPSVAPVQASPAPVVTRPSASATQSAQPGAPAVLPPTPAPGGKATPAPLSQAPATTPLSQPGAPSSLRTVPAPAPAGGAPEAAGPALEEARTMIRDFRSLTGENPEGNNADITKALNGGNPKGARFVTGEHTRINGNGELVDPWDSPFFFHQLSGQQMEIRSAGPDRKMWTDDDQVTQ